MCIKVGFDGFGMGLHTNGWILVGVHAALLVFCMERCIFYFTKIVFFFQSIVSFTCLYLIAPPSIPNC